MIELSDSPQDYGLPFEAWYVNQKALAEACVNAGPYSVLVIQSPVGSGKSALPATVSHFRRHTFSLMGTRELQLQYTESLPMFEILWGQEHYECVNENWRRYFGKRAGRKPAYPDCPIPFYFRKRCESFDECPYEVAKVAVCNARAVATNYATAWHADWWKPSCVDLFADEAHTLPGHVLDLATVEIDARARKAFSLPPFPTVEYGQQHKKPTYFSVRDWLSEAIRLLERATLVKSPNRHSVWAMHLKKECEDLCFHLDTAEEAEWFIQASGDGLLIELVHPRPLAEKILVPEARTIVLMSATIGKPEILVHRLGLDVRRQRFISVTHPFPKENRPVFFMKDAPRINYRTGDKGYAKQADMIANIMNTHPGEKGIVHTASWRHAEKLMDLLAARGQHSRLFLARGKRLEKVAEFRTSPPGTFAVSASWSEGLDLVGDEGSVSVTAKVPFKPIGSPVEKMRLELPGGHEEYKQDAANKVAQQSGRIVRTPTDVGVTYIVDANYSMIKNYVPDWFEVEAI